MKKIEDMDLELDFRRGIDPNSLYELSALLGEGSYGAVYRGKLRKGGEGAADVAIKIIPDADDDLTSLWREIRFLQVLRSPYVVSYIESLLYDNELWLVMELCDGGSLYDLKEANKGQFTEPELQAIMAYCTLGLAHLHAQLSIHRDVKSGNILLTRDGRAKLGDFGISAQLTDSIMKRRTVIGSPYWMAPEVIQETSYDGKADIWSLGITLLELCEGSPPHFNIHPMRAIFMISSKAAPTLKEPEKWSSDMKSFIGRCLIKNCEERATAAELLKHPWINSTIKEITKNESKGLAILEKLVSKHSDAMQKLRSSRFHPPEMNNNNTINNAASSSSEHKDKEISSMNTMNVNNYNNMKNNMDTIRNNNSSSNNYSQNNMSTLRQNTFNKQQMRNASLTKPAYGYDYNSTLKNEMMNGDYNDGTCIIRPQRNGFDGNYDGSGSNFHSDDKDKTMKFSPIDDKEGTLRVNKNYSGSSSSAANNNNTFVNFNDNYYNNNATFIRSNSYDPNATIRPGASSADNRSDMMSALKYFQGDTLVAALPSGVANQPQSDAKRTGNPISSDKKSSSESYSSSSTSSNFYLPDLEISSGASGNDGILDPSLNELIMKNNSENHEKIKDVSLNIYLYINIKFFSNYYFFCRKFFVKWFY